MIAMERRISMQLQRKATTSPEGQQSLLAITKNLAQQNKENTPVTTTPLQKRKSSSARKNTSTTAEGPLQKRVKVRAAKVLKKKGSPLTEKAKPSDLPSCNYGCAHGGLVTMQQMQPYDMKHYLGEGKYLHKKNCSDCTKSLAALFEHLK